MSNHGSWGSGDYNMTSDRNGNVYPRSEMRREWNSKWVHKSEWEERHPQDVIKAVKDNPRVTPVRDESAVVNVTQQLTEPVAFSIIGNGIVLSDDNYSAASEVVIDAAAERVNASSSPLSTYTGLTGVRFSLDNSLFSQDDTIIIGFLDSTMVSSATKSLSASLAYNAASDNFSINIGNFINGDLLSPANTHSYTSGDQICVAINSSGLVELIIGGVTYSYTPGVAVTGLTHFGVYFFRASIGNKVSISQSASIFSGVTDFTMSTIPTLPSYTPW